GEVWTTTPQPMGQDADCQIRHGAGFTRWSKNSHGLQQEMVCFVPVDDPVKVVRLQLTNPSDQPRRVTATYYVHWLLGVSGILGIQPEPNGVRFEPCLPVSWGHAEVILQSARGRIEIAIKDPENVGHGETQIIVDRCPIDGQSVPYPGKGRTCEVVVTILAPSKASTV
ncbi:hypothetical protein N8306_03080, partial [Yoonia sp.]|nr:hypothetical protein [Yoonia sp.]